MGGVTEARRDVQLTSEEVVLVLRRAAELEALADGPGTVHDERYDARAVEEAASEVGLSTAAVRQAVAELRVGSLGGPHTTAAGSPSPARGTPAVPSFPRPCVPCSGDRTGSRAATSLPDRGRHPGNVGNHPRRERGTGSGPPSWGA